MKSVYFLFLSLTMCTFMYSQEDLKNPNYALSFGIADNFRLNKFDMDIAVKKIMDNDNQVRLFLSPRIWSINSDTEVEGNKTSEESFDYSIGVGADYLWILLTNEDINVYGGTGLMFAYSNYDHESTFIAENGDKSIDETTNPMTEIGIRGILGVEWKVSKKIGIHSEYILTGYYTWDKRESKSSFNGINEPTYTTTRSSIFLNTEVLFGVSIYF
ncbi:MAG: hypothetical protein MUP85_16920 [Candidatus Lokiarchaeota archaeon]|nr:hypothetical protein [Candidatus Lokiarchaeota archaeon]